MRNNKQRLNDKCRAEDFLVNEVDMEKNIIHLTSLEAPNTKAKVSTRTCFPVFN